jgi:hypothetical protein
VHGTRLLKERGITVAGLVLTGVDPKELTCMDRASLKRYVVGLSGQRDAANYDDVGSAGSAEVAFQRRR